MLTEILKASFNGTHSFIVIVSRFFLTFMIACVGSYTREYCFLIKRNTHNHISALKTIICAILPALLTITFFDGMLSKLNLGAILLFSFVTGFLGLDLLRYIKQIGVQGVWKTTVSLLINISNSPLMTIINHITSAYEWIKENLINKDDNKRSRTRKKKK